MSLVKRKDFPVIREAQFYSRILMLAVPIILQQFLRVSVDTADSIMLGRIDQLQMSAVSQAQQIFFIFYTLCNGFSAGCCVLIAQYWGRQGKEEIRILFATGIRAVAVFGTVISLLVLTFPQIFMRIYSSDPSIIELGTSYLRIAAFMYLPCGMSTMMFACCRGIEQVKISFIANVISYPINILLDYFLIFGKFGFPCMGIQGAALGAVIARLVEFTILVVFVFKKEKRIQMKVRDLLKSDKRLSRNFYLIGIPIVIHELIWSTGTTAGSAITGQMSISVVGGYNIANTFYQLVACVMNGILQACSIVIGKAIGSGLKKTEIKKQAYSVLVLGFVGGTILGMIMILFGIPFTKLYRLTDETRTYAIQFIAILALIWPFSGVEMTGIIATLRAGGDGKTGLVTDIFTMWLITIPLASLGAFVFGWPAAVVIGIIKFNIVLEALVGVWRIRSMKWIRNLTSC